MSTRLKVSVIVPVYGTAWSLRECLDSLVGQSLCDSEIIVVNDASSDEAGSIIDEYARRDFRIRVITNEVNLNLFESRLRGFERAEGEYIATCDSDDVMPPRALEYLYTAAVRENADIVHGRARELGGKRAGAILYNCEPFRVSTGRAFVASMFGNVRGWNVWGKLFKTMLVHSCLGMFPRNTGWFQAEDIAYCTVLGLAVERYVGINDAVYAYRYSDFRDNRDEAVKKKKIRDQIQILTFVGERIENISDSCELKNAFHAMANHIMASVLWAIPAGTRERFSEDIAKIGLDSVYRPRLLSWRYHYDWVRQNGIKEYGRRIGAVAASMRRSGVGGMVKRVMNLRGEF
jgi:glycosyltransferase involved in cell wall biosynthesis